MREVDQLAGRATAALTRFDGEALEAMGSEAAALRALLEPSGPVAEVPARLRVFAAVLRGTQENLRVLERVRRG